MDGAVVLPTWMLHLVDWIEVQMQKKKHWKELLIINIDVHS